MPFCQAKTKKGNRCKRPVKNTDLCNQHKDSKPFFVDSEDTDVEDDTDGNKTDVEDDTDGNKTDVEDDSEEDEKCIFDKLTNHNYTIKMASKSTQKKSKIHEETIIDILTSNNEFEQIEKVKKGTKTELKLNKNIIKSDNLIKAVKDKEDVISNINNIPIGKYIIHEINGSQNHPDILLLNVKKESISFFPIECKSGKGKIMWNDNVPISNYYFYLFTDTKINKTIIFPGGHKDVMSDEIKKKFIKYKEVIDKLRNDKELENTSHNPQGWGYFPRYNYTQKSNFTNVSEEIKIEWKDIFMKKYTEFIA